MPDDHVLQVGRQVEIVFPDAPEFHRRKGQLVDMTPTGYCEVRLDLDGRRFAGEIVAFQYSELRPYL